MLIKRCFETSTLRAMNILVIEGDRRIAGRIERALSENRDRVSLADTSAQGIELMLGGAFDAALLDDRRH